ncbi:MAG: GAF domain-containing protein, partial [Dehalococcoidales bacterium]|nr:GAF domain-containing protein [Dehalococcoidales bacterium]
GSHVGKFCYQIFQNRASPCHEPLWDCPLQQVLGSGKLATVIHPINLPGVHSYVKITAYPLRDKQGNTRAIVELRRDVTAERELETQILRRHHQLLALNQISSAVSGLYDLDTILNTALDNVLELVNCDIGGILLFDEETQTLGYRVHRGLSAKYVDGVQIPLGESIAGQAAENGEPLVLDDISKDPHVTRPDLVLAEGLKGFVSIPLKAKDKVTGVMNIASHEANRFAPDDVSLLKSIGDYLGTAIEQARLYDSLARAGERYRALLQHALKAQEQERKRIAAELHDETSQAITSLTLSLQAIMTIAEMKGIGDDEFMEKVRATHSFAVHAGYEVVRLMKELRPSLLDELGMPAAIHRYAKDTLQAQGINVSADFTGTDKRFPPEIEVTLFRVAQGLIGNILEHSEAKNTLIQLDCDENECKLYIEDDGKGFNVNKLTRVDPSGRGAGLFTIKERVKLVGGRCRVNSRTGQGTKVTVKVPLTQM